MIVELMLIAAQPEEAAFAAPSQIIERNRLVVDQFYPASARKRGEEGQVGFRIDVDRNGRINGCRVTKSSGYAALDTATCDMVLAGGTATALTKADGRATAGVREGLVDWKLPAGFTRPATPPPFDANLSRTGEQIICRRQLRRDSNFITEKVCLTSADWQRQLLYA